MCKEFAKSMQADFCEGDFVSQPNNFRCQILFVAPRNVSGDNSIHSFVPVLIFPFAISMGHCSFSKRKCALSRYWLYTVQRNEIQLRKHLPNKYWVYTHTSSTFSDTSWNLGVDTRLLAASFRVSRPIQSLCAVNCKQATSCVRGVLLPSGRVLVCRFQRCGRSFDATPTRDCGVDVPT